MANHPRRFAALALMVCISMAPAFAGKHAAKPLPARKATKTPIDEFQRMSPEQRQKALNALPKEERQKLQQRLQNFNSLPPEQQRTLKSMYNRLQQLPPERQQAVRKSVNKLSQQPAQRQQAMRDELKSMAAMSADERQAHMASPTFRGSYSRKEQEIVRDMSDLLPPQ